jgi:type IV pilus assembly protein PilA
MQDILVTKRPLKRGRLRRDQAGFSFLEVLTVCVIIGVLSGLVIPNYREFRSRAYEAVARSDLRNVKFGTFALINDPDSTLYFLVANQKGPGPLPYPLSSITLSKDVRLTIAVHLKFFEAFEFTFIQLGHEGGNYWYRYVEFNRQSLEQVIPK